MNIEQIKEVVKECEDKIESGKYDVESNKMLEVIRKLGKHVEWLCTRIEKLEAVATDAANLVNNLHTCMLSPVAGALALDLKKSLDALEPPASSLQPNPKGGE